MTAHAIDLEGRQVPAITHVSREILREVGTWLAVAEVWERIVETAKPAQLQNIRNGHVPPHLVADAIEYWRSSDRRPRRAV